MLQDFTQYLQEGIRVQTDHEHEVARKWVSESYEQMQQQLQSMPYAQFSQNGEWIECTLYLPLSTFRISEHRRKIELLRRRFVMDGWARVTLDENDSAPALSFQLAAPREQVTVRTGDGAEFVPEIRSDEGPDQAVHRILREGATYYRTPWQAVIVPPHQIARLDRRIPGEDSEDPKPQNA